MPGWQRVIVVIELDGLILDMDGVLWRGSQPMEGLTAFFELLERLGIGYVLATNNATRTVQQYVDKLADLGVQVRPEQVLTSACATAEYLVTVAPPGTAVFAIGEAGLIDALESRGFRLTSDGAQYVVAGLDRDFDYHKLSQAMQLILNGARFIGTNPDRTFPAPEGLQPGAGAVLAAIGAAAGVEPLIVGKPQPLMFQMATARLGTRPERTAMVGDRLDTDISGGQSAGLRTVLVLSGVTGRQQLQASSIKPDWVVDDIRALTAALEG